MDLLVKHAKVYDGTGSPWFRASLGIQAGRIQILRGDTSGVEAARVIDADGLAVCPGFIDMHAHSTMVILGEPHHDAKVRQGVTTELIGVDGNSYAPFLDPEDLERWSVFNAGLDGEKPHGMTWSSVDEYLDVYDEKVAVNIAYVLGNTPLRVAAVGWNDRQPTSSEMAQMRQLLKQGMEEGAFGMSTGLTYPPGSYASTEELEELATVTEKLGGLHVSHVRYSLGDMFRDPFMEMIDITRRTGVALHISHYASRWRINGQFRPLLAMVDDARNDGLSVTFDAYPYNYGGSRATVALPDWIEEGGPEPLLQRLADPAARGRMREETDPRQCRWRNPKGWHLTGFKEPGNEQYDGLNLHAIADHMGQDPLDALCDLMLAENARLSYVGHDSNNQITVRKLLAHPACMVGSDAVLVGDNPSPRSYGSFPKMLGDLVREEELMSFPEAIRKMTSFPAAALGISDRGVVRNGAMADLVIFDPTTVQSGATLEHPCVFPDGIPYVIVNGTIVIDDGVHTGATPGRALRRAS